MVFTSRIVHGRCGPRAAEAAQGRSVPRTERGVDVVPEPMKNMKTPWSGARLDRLRLLSPALLALIALVLAACNNGSGGSGY
jgi:hypothetical protein